MISITNMQNLPKTFFIITICIGTIFCGSSQKQYIRTEYKGKNDVILGMSDRVIMAGLGQDCQVQYIGVMDVGECRVVAGWCGGWRHAVVVMLQGEDQIFTKHMSFDYPNNKIQKAYFSTQIGLCSNSPTLQINKTKITSKVKIQANTLELIIDQAQQQDYGAQISKYFALALFIISLLIFVGQIIIVALFLYRKHRKNQNPSASRVLSSISNR